MAIVFAILADGIISIPTFKKAFFDPTSETPAAWFLLAIGAALGIIASTKFDMANILFPAYLITANLIIGSFVLRGRTISGKLRTKRV